MKCGSGIWVWNGVVLYVMVVTTTTTLPVASSFQIMTPCRSGGGALPFCSMLPTSLSSTSEIPKVVPLLVSSTTTISTGRRSFPSNHTGTSHDASRYHNDHYAAARRQPRQMIRYAMDVLGFMLLSFLFSVTLISWEDLTGRYVLPNRHRTAISLGYPSTSWGTTTVRGMGFGSMERQQLIDDAVSFELSEPPQNFVDIDPFLKAPTYNEVMLHHRTVTIPRWKQRTLATAPMISNAIHNILESLQQLEILRDLANDYQWEPLRQQLRTPPLSEWSVQSALLRPLSSELNEVVGFDWGSCAWRGHACGATADGQEAMDEMDQLLGVLEPHEILFCIDIIERSLRDILAVIPWHAPYASESDIVRYQNLPPYVALVQRVDTVDDDDDFVALSRIDSEYVKALQELRIDD